jgi:transcriptional regulator with XRE-family HTH domain
MKKSISQEESLLLALGQVILKRRTRARMSQQELADLSEVHRPYISDIERGQRNLTITTMIRISNALKAPLSTLFREAEAGMGKAGR